MTIHTDTFPLVVQQAANNPAFSLDINILNGKPFVYLCNKEEHSHLSAIFDITLLFTESQLRSLAKDGKRRIKINLIDNSTFKHLLERLAPRDSVLL
jgi:hypothetical protein